MYAQIIVNRPTHRQPPAGSDPLRADTSRLVTYTYRLPDALRDMALVGQLVQVPLGPSNALGVIAALASEPPPDLEPGLVIRDVAEILDLMPVAIPTQINLAHWIAQEYLEPLSQAMRMMLPPGLEERTFVVATETAGKTAPATAGELAPVEREALRLLRRRGGRMRLGTLLGHIQHDDPEAVINSLVDQGLLDTRFAFVPPQPAPPRIQFVRLLADDDAIEAALPQLGHASKQADVLLILARRGDVPLTLPEVCQLAACSESPVRALADRDWVEITARRTLVVALPGSTGADLDRAPKQSAVMRALQVEGGPQELGHIQRITGASLGVIAALEEKGLVQRIQEEPMVLLTLPRDQVLDRVLELRGAHVERAVLDALQGTTGRVWVGGLYAETGAELNNLRNLADRGLISLHAEEYDRPRPDKPETPLTLTPDQQAAWQRIKRGMESRRPEAAGFVALLHGVTGSGKTEIYLHALEATLAAGRRAIVLVPEISLTAQTVLRFEMRFPGRVAVIHSQLSLGQRYAVWDRVRRGEADVVIGPRSALLAPVSRLGLIVLDEAHDDSYKQTEPIPLPAYHARDVACALGRLTGATVLFGSATPDLVTYHRATQGDYGLLQLPHRIHNSEAGIGRADGSSLPPVRVVDLRQELRAGNRSIFSRPLQEALRRSLSAGEQAILFLNRRGTATFVLCRDCGHVARCPDCDVPLTLHRSAHSKVTAASGSTTERLICHHCNRQETPPQRCPGCGGRRIRYFGLGTERVEAAVRELYPGARLLRWDADTATGADHERFLQAFLEHRADVLVGTQMIAKGLDLPLVTLVGVISADTALYLPDYRAAERTFQLLTQVAGRAGRSYRGGQVIIQTYNPSHYAIQAAAGHDYVGFYQQELAYRRQLAYPPFSRLVALRRSDRDPYRARGEAERLGRWLTQEIQRRSLPVSLIGPAPCFFSRSQGRYRWQIVLRAAEPLALLRQVALPQGWRIDVDPVNLL